MTQVRRKGLDSRRLETVEEFFAGDGGERPASILKSPALLAPASVSVDAGRLIYRWLSSTHSTGEEVIAPPPTLWQKFAALDRRGDEDLRNFARRWGSLSGKHGIKEETLSDWRNRIAFVAAAVRLARSLNYGDGGSPRDWAVICTDGRLVPLLNDDTEPILRKDVIAGEINRRYAEAKDHAIIDVMEGEFLLRPRAAGILGVVLVQLAYFLIEKSELARCSGCHKLFPPKYIRPGCRSFCKTCRRKGAPARYASQMYRARKKQRTREGCGDVPVQELA